MRTTNPVTKVDTWKTASSHTYRFPHVNSKNDKRRFDDEGKHRCHVIFHVIKARCGSKIALRLDQCKHCEYGTPDIVKRSDLIRFSHEAY